MTHPTRLQKTPLVLASSSPYRRALLQRLGLPFTCAIPDIDESPRPAEPAETLARRLAAGKAEALAVTCRHHLIIGSDQVAALPDGTILGKPGGPAQAIRQLQASAGKTVTFHTGLALLNTATARIDTRVEVFRVVFRDLSNTTIERYVSLEKPFDCAGSFRAEGMGIALFRAMEGSDPNSLVGLPLIALCSLLEAQGINVLDEAYRSSKRDSMI